MGTTYPRTMIKARDLQLGDVLNIGSLGTAAWHTAIVNRIEGENIHLFRPYGTHADFSYTGGVICYVGIEQYTIPRMSDVEYYVHERCDLK